MRRRRGDLVEELRVRRSMSPGLAFVVVAFGFFVTMTAAGAPAPLYVVYEDRWGFPTIVLTVAFAIYTFGLLASLLVFGSLSDFVGRRPLMIGALALNLIAMTAFVLAPSIEWIVVARLIQGIATGVATSTFSAALVDLAPEHDRARGALVGTVVGPAGLAVGSLASGVGVVLAPSFSATIFAILGVAMVLTLVAVVFVPETRPRSPGALRSLVPRVSVPPPARATFIRVVPAVIAGWMIAGLFLGLVPSIIRDVIDVHSGVVNGFGVFAQTATTALGGLVLGRISGRRSTLVGCIAVAAGALLLVVSILLGSLPVLLIGAAVSGFGVGGAYAGSLRVVAPLAPAAQRAQLFAASYVLAYLAFGVPTLIAGLVVAQLGLLAVAVVYTAAAVLFAAAGAINQLRPALA